MLGLSGKGAARADRRGSTCCSLPTAPGGPRRDLTPRCRGQAGGLRRPGHSGLLSGGRDAGRTAQGPTVPPGTATQGDTREHTPTDASFHPQSHRPWAHVQRPCLPSGNCRRKGSRQVAAGGGAGATSVARKGQAVRTDGRTLHSGPCRVGVSAQAGTLCRGSVARLGRGEPGGRSRTLALSHKGL